MDSSTQRVISSLLTVDDGSYSFAGLIAGDYVIRHAPHIGWVQTLPASGIYSIALGYREDRTGTDFGSYPPTAEISGRKFEDLNANGVFDADEPGLADWRIYLDIDANGQWDTGEPFDLTDSQGQYAVSISSPGLYALAEEPQHGSLQTLPIWEGIERVHAHLGSPPKNSDFENGLSISGDGRYVAFRSESPNLVPGDTNYFADIFVLDRQTNTIERVNVNTSGMQANADSYKPSISADGRYVAFQSYASTLVPGDTNGDSDVFIHDRLTGSTDRVSVDSNGAQGGYHSYDPNISADGRYVALVSLA